MATVNDVLGGLKVFAKHRGEKHEIQAEHDIIYACCAADLTLSPEEHKQLRDAGWFVDGEIDCWALYV